MFSVGIVWHVAQLREMVASVRRRNFLHVTGRCRFKTDHLDGVEGVVVRD